MKTKDIVEGEFYAVALPSNSEYSRRNPKRAQVISTKAMRKTHGDSWGMGRTTVPAVHVFVPEFPEERRNQFVAAAQVVRHWDAQKLLLRQIANADALRAEQDAKLDRRREAVRSALELPGLARTRYSSHVEVPLEELEALVKRVCPDLEERP